MSDTDASGSAASGGASSFGSGAAPPVAEDETPAALEPVGPSALDIKLKAVWDRLHAEEAEANRLGSDQDRSSAKGARPAEKGRGSKNFSGQPADRGGGRAGTDEDAGDDPVSADRPPPRSGNEPPPSWSDEMKARWATVPSDVRSCIAQREADAHQAITRAGQERATFEPVRAVIEQHRDIFERADMAPEIGIGAMLAVERMLQQNPVAAIEEIAKAYGVDLSGRGAAQTPAAAELAALRSEVARLTSQQAARRSGEFHAAVDGLNRTIADLSGERPDWDEVEETIIGLIPGIRANFPGLSQREILTRAYEAAIWANPRTRSRAKLAEERTRAAEARRVKGVSVRSKPAARQPKTQDEILQEIALKAYGPRR